MKKNIIIVMAVCVVTLICMLATTTYMQEGKAQLNRELAVLVNNGDYPIEVINQIAVDNGFKGYDDMVEYLVSIGELYHIPAFTYEGEDYNFDYQETYTVKNTIVYNDAVEMGIIKE